MATLDEITKEKQRISVALARVDTQRERLVGQLSELEAAERVLARYSKDARARRTASANPPTMATQAAAPTRQRGRRRTATAIPAGGGRGLSNLSDQVLALATGKTQREIAAACKGARPNHVGAAIARHKRAGRIEERDGRLYVTQSTGTEQRAAV
jgi:hypothetical protein